MGVAFGSMGTKVSSPTTALNIPYPTSGDGGAPANGDILVMVRVLWNSAAVADDVAGWTSRADGTSGTGTANGNHTTRIRIDTKPADGTETGNVAVTASGTVSGQIGRIFRYTNATGGWSVVGSGTVGGDTTHNGNRATSDGGSVSVASGDLLFAGIAIDVATALSATSPNIVIGGTASGVGTNTFRDSTVGTTDGNDGNLYAVDAPYTGTTKSGAGSFSMSTGIAQCGPVGFLRLREAAGPGSLAPVYAFHAVASDTTTLTQVHVLAPADAVLAVTADSPSLTNPGDPPPWGGTGRENTFDDTLNVYNYKAANTARIRAALAAADAGTGLAVVAVLGDSAAVPYNGSSIDDENSFARRAVQQIATILGISEAGHGMEPALWASAAAYKGEYWTTTGSTSLIGNLAGLMRCNLGSTATCAPPQSCTDLELYFSGDSNAFTYQIDGGTAVPVTPSGDGSALEKIHVGGLTSGSHSIKVNMSGGVVWLAGAAFWSDGPGILLMDVAYGGTRAAQGAKEVNWTDDTGAMPSIYKVRKGMADLFGLDPDLCLWMIGGNDIFQGDTVTNAIDGLEEMIGWYPDADHIMTGAWEVSGTNLTTWDAYWAAKYQLADDLDIPLIDWRAGVAETNAIADGLGYTGADGEHPSTAALTIMGDNLADILLTEFPPTVTDLAPADAALGVSTDSPALTQVHQLAPADSALGVSSDIPAFTQLHVLQPADSEHIHGAEQPSIVGESDLAPATARLTHVATAPAIAQIHVLQPQDADLGHSSSAPGLSVGFTPDDASLGHSADSPVIGQTHALAAADSEQQHATSSPALTQIHQLDPVDSFHGHTAEKPSISGENELAPDRSELGHGAGSPVLGQVHELAPEPALVELGTDSPALIQLHQLEPADTDHQHAVESPSLTGENELAPLTARLTHSASSPELAQVHALTPGPCSIEHTASEPTLAQAIDLEAASSAHGHAATEPALTQAHQLAPVDAQIEHTADAPAFGQTHILAAASSAHQHTTSLAELTQQHALAALDAVLHHDTESPSIVTLGGTPPRERTLTVLKDHRDWTVSPDFREWRVPPDRKIGSAP